MDIGCCLVYTARLIFAEEPARVSALIETDPEMRTDVMTSAILDFPSGQAVFTAGYVGAIALVAMRALSGAASAGDVVVVAGLAGQVGGLVEESARALNGSLGILQVVARLRWLERYAT